MTGHRQVGRRVALVANPSADLYGSDRMMLETVQGLVGSGWEVVVAASQPGPLAEQLLLAGARFVVVPAPVVRRSNLSPRGAIGLARDLARGIGPMMRLVREVRPDVLYVNTVTIPLWLAVGRALRVRTVNHVHEAESSVSALARYGLTVPTRLAHLVIYNSEVTRAVAVSSGGRRSRTTVIHNGVAGPDTVRPPRHEVPAPRLAYVGRLSPRKGVDVAVEALAQLRRRDVDATLDLVGAVFPGYEWYEDRLRDQVRTAGLEKHVRFLGFREDVWPHLAEADIVLMPSRGEESFGNTVVEAALSARPAVVSDHSGLREAARPLASAVMVAPGDPTAIASAVSQLLDRWPEARASAAADAVTAAGEYAPERYRDEVVGALGRLVNP
jgi:hypothetical protein